MKADLDATILGHGFFRAASSPAYPNAPDLPHITPNRAIRFSSMAGTDTEDMIAGGTANLVLDYLARRGLDRTTIETECGLHGWAPEPTSKISRASNIAVWQSALATTNDPALGIHVAQFAQVGALGLVEYLGRTASTLEDAVGLVGAFSRDLHGRVAIDVAEAEGPPPSIVVRHYTIEDRTQLPAAVDFAAAYLVCVARQIAGFSFGLLSVCLARPKPSDPSEWLRFYRVPVEFGGQKTELTIDIQAARRPLPNADPRLHQLLRQQAENSETLRPKVNGFLDEVRAAILETLVADGGRGESIRKRLGLSERTMRRRLAEHGCSLSGLRDSVRHARALELEGFTAQADLAAELGFTTAGAYRRAFARWTGLSPRAWRSRNRSA